MAITSYATLQSSIKNWLNNRTDLDAVVPDFISNVEKDLNRRLRHYKMIDRDDATLDTRFLQLPNDFLETVRFGITSGTTSRLELSTLDAMLLQREQTSNATGTPRQYAHIGNQIEVFPTPSGDHTVQLTYYAKLAPLSDTNTTNFVLEDAPDVYLYGALVHSAPFLMDDTRLQVWASLYESALASFQNASDNTRAAGSGLRMRVTSY